MVELRRLVLKATKVQRSRKFDTTGHKIGIVFLSFVNDPQILLFLPIDEPPPNLLGAPVVGLGNEVYTYTLN